MNFEHYQYLLEHMFDHAGDGMLPGKNQDIPPERLHPLVLAYIGDAFFSLYVRTRLLSYEQNKVRVLHTFDAQIVSAKLQSFAVRQLEGVLSELELDIIRRGRNTKSRPTKNASVAEYRYSTGFEALIGYLFLSKNTQRLFEIVENAFVVISREMTNKEIE